MAPQMHGEPIIASFYTMNMNVMPVIVDDSVFSPWLLSSEQFLISFARLGLIFLGFFLLVDTETMKLPDTGGADTDVLSVLILSEGLLTAGVGRAERRSQVKVTALHRI